MHPEVDELRPKLKEILYDCAVEIRATKAALYLFDGTSRFELVSEYGFRGVVRATADTNDPVVDRCGRGRTPFFVNGLAAEPRFAQLMYDSSTDRLLAVPLYSRGKLIGFIDMRDKGAKAAFEKEDLAKAQGIAERIVELVGAKNIFGHRFIELSQLAPANTPPPSSLPPLEAPSRVSAEPPLPVQSQSQTSAAAPAPAAAPRPAVQPPPQETAHVPRLATLVLEARTAASRMGVAAGESIGENELPAIREALRAILLIPGAVAATFSALDPSGGVQEISSRSTLTEEARNLIQSKLNVWLTKRGESSGFVRTSMHTPFGASGAPVTAADAQKVFTAPLQAGSMKGLYLTVAFAGNPDRVAHELLAVLHSHLQLVIEQTMQRGTIASLQSRIAAKLVEPDFAKYPELRQHCEATAKLSESFARFLSLSNAETENARIVALVHDCGMRLLDYERLYRKRDLSPEELGFLREHPSVSAALVEPLLGPDIARAVLCHHERVDGRGYPNELHGDEIPLAARIVQICDAYVTMIDPNGYQAPESPQQALATVARVAGEQFDSRLAGQFVEMMRVRER